MDIIMDLKVAIVLSVAFMITGLKLYTLRSFDTITKKKKTPLRHYCDAREHVSPCSSRTGSAA